MLDWHEKLIISSEFSRILVAPLLVADFASRSHGGAFAGLGFLIAHLLSGRQFYMSGNLFLTLLSKM